MNFLKEVLTTIFAVLIFSMYGYLRFNNIKLEELDLLLIGAFMGQLHFYLVMDGLLELENGLVNPNWNSNQQLKRTHLNRIKMIKKIQKESPFGFMSVI